MKEEKEGWRKESGGANKSKEAMIHIYKNLTKSINFYAKFKTEK